MKYYKLNDLCTNIIDCPHSTPQWKSDGIRVVRNFNLNNGNLDFSDGYFVDKDTYLARVRRGAPEEGDIIISREAPMGVVAIVPVGLKCCLGQRLVLLKINKEKINPYYLLFILMSDFVQTQFKRADSTGSIVSNLCIPDLKEILIPVVDDGQENVAEFLKNINEKIQLNKKINDNLQQQLKLLYDYWFTQFEFPDENGNSYKSSGGKMSFNHDLSMNIPYSWSTKKLSEICNIILGGTPNTDIPEYWNGTINWINSGEVAQFPVVKSELKITQAGVDNSSAKLMPIGTTIVSITGNIRTSILAINTCANQSVVGILESKYIKFQYIHQFMIRMIEQFKVMSTGNCQQHINKGIIEEAIIVIPDSRVLNAYYKVAKPLYDRITKNALENLELTHLRDWLLPMLMNGQVTIAD